MTRRSILGLNSLPVGLKPAGMKNLSNTMKCCVLITAAFSLMGLSECDRKHNIVLNDPTQIIIPGTEIGADDVCKLRKILNRFDGEFYIIQPFEDGIAQPPFGKLSDIFIPKPFREETNESRPLASFSRWTRVLGQGCFTRCGRHSKSSKDESERLVKAVTRILKKYQEAPKSK